jgi:TrmH family RNA methyltransferase
MEKASRTQLKKIRELIRERRVRDAEGRFVAEGRKIVGDMISAGGAVDSVIASRGFAEDDTNVSFLAELAGSGAPVFVTDNRSFDGISDLQNPQGILAVFRKPQRQQPVVTGDGSAFFVLCDGIQDPGNIGSMVRASAAFGVRSILLFGDTADIYSPKVVRASSGTVLDVPVHDCDADEIDRLKREGCRLLASSVTERGSEDIAGFEDLTGPLILAFGSEGRGMSPEVSDKADAFFHIPIHRTVESLNVTAAAAIALYVFTSVRR